MGRDKDRENSYLLPSQAEKKPKQPRLGKNLFILIYNRTAWWETEINAKDPIPAISPWKFLDQIFQDKCKDTHGTSQSRTCWSPESHQDWQQKHPQHIKG